MLPYAVSFSSFWLIIPSVFKVLHFSWPVYYLNQSIHFVRRFLTTFRILSKFIFYTLFLFYYVLNQSRITSLFSFQPLLYTLPPTPPTPPLPLKLRASFSFIITVACMCAQIYKYNCQSHFYFCVFMVSCLTTLH